MGIDIYIIPTDIHNRPLALYLDYKVVDKIGRPVHRL